MGDPVEHALVDRTVTIEKCGREAVLAELSLSLGTAAGAGYPPAGRDEPAGERLGAVAQAEAEEMLPVHDGWRAGAGEGSASSVSAMRFCLRLVHAQKLQETSAPAASGRRNPKWPLSEPINTAPTA